MQSQSAITRWPLILCAAFSVAGCAATPAVTRGPDPDTGLAGAVQVVYDLRARTMAEDWRGAAELIDPEGPFAGSRGSMLPDQPEFWKLQPPVFGDETMGYPLGYKDRLGFPRMVGARAEVQLVHQPRYEKDPRPHTLILERKDGAWKVVSSRNS